MSRTGNPHQMIFLGACLLGTLLHPAPAPAQDTCDRLHLSLDSAGTVQSAGATIAGTVSYSAGVNAAAGVFAKSGQVNFTLPAPLSPAGSFAFWVRKDSGDPSGGIAQLGQISFARSIGLFYLDSGDLVFEARNDAAELASVYVPDALPAGQWRHVAATWRHGPAGTDLWLYLDGQYVGYGYLAGPFTHAGTQLQVGRTGFYLRGDVSIDEFRLFDRTLHDGEVFAEFVYSSNRFVLQPTAKPVSTGPVQLVDGKLLVEGEPFAVRGVNYSPEAIGYPPGGSGAFGNPAVHARDAALLRALGVNVIRTYTPPPDTQLLDALYNDGVDPIYVIVGFWIETTGVDYDSPAYVAQKEFQFAQVVNRFKDHPGLLAWGLGNELALTVPPAELPAAYGLANRLAERAWQLEGPTWHPSLIVNAHMGWMANVDAGSDDASLDCIDIWGHNVYFGDHPGCYFDYYRLISSKPLLVTEFGIDALDHRTLTEYEAVQADYMTRQWRWIEPRGLGGVVFVYSDEWWKNGNPTSHDPGGYGTAWHPDGHSDEEWWGLVRPSANPAGPPGVFPNGLPDVMTPRAAYYALANEFAYPPGDSDADGDRDVCDFARLQTCFGGPADGVCGSAFERVVDGDIDFADAEAWFDLSEP